MGIVCTIQPANKYLQRVIRNQKGPVTSELYPLVTDPQMSDGLLVSVPQDRTKACLEELKALGYPVPVIVGKVLAESEHLKPVTSRN